VSVRQRKEVQEVLRFPAGSMKHDARLVLLPRLASAGGAAAVEEGGERGEDQQGR
jgi:hypothetical protein